MHSPNILVVPTYLVIVDDDGERVALLRERLAQAFRQHDEVFALGSVEWLNNNRDLMGGNPVQAVLVGRWNGWERSRIRQELAESYPDVPVCFIDQESEPASAGDQRSREDRPATNPVTDRLRRILRESVSPEGDTAHLQTAGDEDRGGPDWLFRGLSGGSPAIHSVVNDIILVAASDSTVLITGADGAGKEIAARSIHFQSPRRLEPFVSVRCNTMPPEQLEDELFGDTTRTGGADVANRVGRFEIADGGTLFLEEIAAMDMSIQLRLLRVLQERTLESRSGGRMRQVNVRIVATTRHDLDRLVAEGRFREDLYKCLAVFPIRMPALQERIEDLPVLIEEVQRSLHQTEADRVRFSATAMGILAQYGWPGNLRELSGFVRELSVRYPGREVDIDDLPPEYRPRAGVADESGSAPPLPDSRAEGVDLERYLADMERFLIRQALEDAGGVVADAAERLKLRHDALIEKMRTHRI